MLFGKTLTILVLLPPVVLSQRRLKSEKNSDTSTKSPKSQTPTQLEILQHEFEIFENKSAANLTALNTTIATLKMEQVEQKRAIEYQEKIQDKLVRDANATAAEQTKYAAAFEKFRNATAAQELVNEAEKAMFKRSISKQGLVAEQKTEAVAQLADRTRKIEQSCIVFEKDTKELHNTIEKLKKEDIACKQQQGEDRHQIRMLKRDSKMHNKTIGKLKHKDSAFTQQQGRDREQIRMLKRDTTMLGKAVGKLEEKDSAFKKEQKKDRDQIIDQIKKLKQTVNNLDNEGAMLKLTKNVIALIEKQGSDARQIALLSEQQVKDGKKIKHLIDTVKEQNAMLKQTEKNLKSAVNRLKKQENNVNEIKTLIETAKKGFMAENEKNTGAKKKEQAAVKKEENMAENKKKAEAKKKLQEEIAKRQQDKKRTVENEKNTGAKKKIEAAVKKEENMAKYKEIEQAKKQGQVMANVKRDGKMAEDNKKAQERLKHERTKLVDVDQETLMKVNEKMAQDNKEARKAVQHEKRKAEIKKNGANKA